MGATEDTVRGLGKIGGCLGGAIAAVAVVGIVIRLLCNGIRLLADFVFEVIPDFWGKNWRWIVFPILALVVLKIAREIGREK